MAHLLVKPRSRIGLGGILNRNPHKSTRQKSLERKVGKANRKLRKNKLRGFFQPSKPLDIFPANRGFPTYDFSTVNVKNSSSDFLGSLRKFKRANLKSRVILPKGIKAN